MLLRTLITGTLLAAGAFAQLSSFPKPAYFRETFSKSQPKVELKDPVRLKDFVVGDKLELSLKDYLALVMSNNTDIQLQMLSLETPKNAIQRAFGIWDPRATASFNSTRATTPPTSALDGTANALKTLSQPLAMSVTQTLPEGINYTVAWGGSKATSNSNLSTYNPALASNLSITFSQPLLQNRGTYVNRLNLMSARSRLKINEFGLKGSLLNLVSTAESAYWDVVSARESLKVAIGARDVSAEFLKLSQKQLELGALSPLDIYNPQQQLATNEVSVAQARFTLTQREDALRKQISADLDPQVRALPLVLTDAADMPLESINFDRERAIQQALEVRPDLKQAVQSLDVDDLGIQAARNALLPNLALTGNYTVNGRGGVFVERTNAFNNSGVSSTVLTSIPGGIADALDQMFGFGFSSYQLGLRLTLPIRSRAASADMADAVVRRKQDTLTVRTTQQTIRLDILNAITNVESSKESVKLAKVAREFAQKALDAENKKYELGTELSQNVLLAQNALAQAESTVVTNQIALRKNLLNLLVKIGTLLDERGIVLQP
uniref:Outer membrane efflux protein n=1 Tax=Solibacter usitatus (strain Ellin6076) TaxID=234267 RepID=Q01SG3_SOLUE